MQVKVDYVAEHSPIAGVKPSIVPPPPPPPKPSTALTARLEQDHHAETQPRCTGSGMEAPVFSRESSREHPHGSAPGGSGRGRALSLAGSATVWGTVTTAPFTLTSPEKMSCSAARLDAMPAAASTCTGPTAALCREARRSMFSVRLQTARQSCHIVRSQAGLNIACARRKAQHRTLLRRLATGAGG